MLAISIPLILSSLPVFQE